MGKKIYITETPLINQWDFSKNKENPGEVSANSHKRFWWLCEKGHSWSAIVKNRHRNCAGCPICSGRCPSKENNLSVIRPDILIEWDKVKNSKLFPEDFMPFSNRNVWWKCNKCGNEWQASIYERCSGHKNCKQCVSLATLRPDIAVQWHLTKNGKLTPNDFTCRSHKKVWWVCERRHEWKTSIASRCGLESGCPYCSGQKVCKDNCLATLRPEIAAQWHPIKNGNLTPSDVTPSSGKKAWWACEGGHSWCVSIYNRSKGSGCPYCSGRAVCKDNCLATLKPDLSKEWHPTKNGNLTPYDFTYCSNKKVWWQCSEGHEWCSSINNRYAGKGCPRCSNKPHSKIGDRWLDSLGIPVENREITLPDLKFRVDAFMPETNTTYEFFGDYWHGNPEKYSAAEKNSHSGKTFGELYEETKTRITRLGEAGYKIVYIWENDFKHTILKEKNGKNRYKSNKKSL